MSDESDNQLANLPTVSCQTCVTRRVRRQIILHKIVRRTNNIKLSVRDMQLSS
jgi:hypothetical protein